VNTRASAVPEPTVPEPQPQPATAKVVQGSPTNAPTVSLPPKENAAPEFRLSGIIYTVARPSAIVNGKTVYVGEEIDGATVISIRQTAVTLQVAGKRRTYDLR
jgi:hypothetical protein